MLFGALVLFHFYSPSDMTVESAPAVLTHRTDRQMRGSDTRPQQGPLKSLVKLQNGLNFDEPTHHHHHLPGQKAAIEIELFPPPE